MVERNARLDSVFHSLSDSTRRDILRRVSQRELSISELARPYRMSFAAVAKHVAVLESARLVRKHQVGKQHRVRVEPQTVQLAQELLEKYKKLWMSRFSALDDLLAK